MKIGVAELASFRVAANRWVIPPPSDVTDTPLSEAYVLKAVLYQTRLFRPAGSRKGFSVGPRRMFLKKVVFRS